MLTHNPTKILKTKDVVEKFSHLKLTEVQATRRVEKTSGVYDRAGSQVTRLQTATSPEVMTPMSEDMTSYTELSDVTSPDLKRTYQALLSRGVGTWEYLPLFTSTPSRDIYSREISWPMRDLETSTGESVNLSDTDDYVDVVNA